MRLSSILSPVALVMILASPVGLWALPVSEGKVVHGRYTAFGRSATSGVKVAYRSSAVRVTAHGRIFGRVERRVTSRGHLLQVSTVKVFGTVRAVRVRTRKNTFYAPAVVHIADGAEFQGQFVGLADPSERISRFFRGKLASNKNSNLLLRSR